MNYIDLVALALVLFYMGRGLIRGAGATFLSLAAKLIGLALGFMLYGRLADAVFKLINFDATAHLLSNIPIDQPAGVSTPLEGALDWLRNANLPAEIAEAIRTAWFGQPSVDLAALGINVGQVLLVVLVNLACFVALFVVGRFITGLFAGMLIRALPPDYLGSGRAVGVSLGIIESMIVVSLLLALLMPLAAGNVLIDPLNEHVRQAKFADIAWSVLRLIQFSYLR